MYGSQVWGTGFLQAGREFSSPLSTLHLHFLKGTLGVKQPTTNWAVLRECGHAPLQFYWFRSAVKLFNSMLNTNIFFWWFYSYGPQQEPDRQQKKRGGRAQAEEKARGSCSRRPRTSRLISIYSLVQVSAGQLNC